MKKYRKQIQRFMENLYLILLVTPLIPACFTLAVNEEGREVLDFIYWQSWIFAIPTVLIEVLEKKCKHFVTYLVLGMGIVVFVCWLAGLCGGITMSGNMLIIFQALLVIETLAVWGLHFHDRMLENPKPHMPSFGYSAAFVIYYGLGMLFDGKILCDISFYSCILYLLVTTVYQFIEQTEQYIGLNHAVKNVPVARLFSIGGAMLASLLLMIFLAMLPSVFAAGSRYYTDVRDIEVEPPTQEESWEMDTPQVQMNGMSMEEQLKLLGEEEVKKIPAWIENLFKCLVYFILICTVIMCVKEIFRKLSRFQKSFQENDDVIEDIVENKETIASIFVRTKRAPETEREKIRRQYRKMIRRYRKDRPYEYETPKEIEKEAGLLDKEEMKALHVRYEEARYADERKPIGHTE